MITDRSFRNMFNRTRAEFLNYSEEVHTLRWQGTDISKRPDMKSHELLNWRCEVSLDFLTQLKPLGVWSQPAVLDELAGIVEPNLPWADDHFLERVCGEPLNPGTQWANWPWAASADKHRLTATGQVTDAAAPERAFNHTYMERLWPKWAGLTPGGKMDWAGEDQREVRAYPGDPEYFIMDSKDGNGTRVEPHRGIRHFYGDLQSLVNLLADEPDTRQAWIPLFFPEDTGHGDGGRKPCTLGYQFILRNNQLHIYYPLRSCDYVRHFRDDIYLAVRLLLWVIDRCQELNPAAWNPVTPGNYVMHCTSLHVFANDFIKMKAEA